MKRDQIGTMKYWNEAVSSSTSQIEKVNHIRSSGLVINTSYEPQYVYELSLTIFRLILERYSRGDPVTELAQHFPAMLEAWEEAERLGKDIWSDEMQYTRHAWTVNLDHYINCFWLTGLALTLDIPDDQWQRLLRLMGNEGEDVLLDRVIASRQRERQIGTKLCFPKAYQRLLDAVTAPVNQRPQRLRAFLDHWYSSLKDAGCPDWPKAHRTPHWYTYGDWNFEGGAYFGRWCVEAAAVVKAFDIDDQLCLNHPNYPGDLLQDGRSLRYPDAALSVATESEQPEPIKSATTTRGWLSRLLRKS